MRARAGTTQGEGAAIAPGRCWCCIVPAGHHMRVRTRMARAGVRFSSHRMPESPFPALRHAGAMQARPTTARPHTTIEDMHRGPERDCDGDRGHDATFRWRATQMSCPRRVGEASALRRSSELPMPAACGIASGSGCIRRQRPTPANDAALVCQPVRERPTRARRTVWRLPMRREPTEICQGIRPSHQHDRHVSVLS